MRPNCCTLLVCIGNDVCRFKERKRMLGSGMGQLPHKEEGRECSNTAPRPGTSPASTPARGSRTDLEKTACFIHETTHPGKFTETRQVQSKAEKSIHASGRGLGLVRITRIRHSVLIAEHISTDETGLRTSQDTGPNQQGPCQTWPWWVRDWQRQAELKRGPGSRREGAASGVRSGAERAFGALRDLTLHFGRRHVFYFLYNLCTMTLCVQYMNDPPTSQGYT